jgi:hypothetical protein
MAPPPGKHGLGHQDGMRSHGNGTVAPVFGVSVANVERQKRVSDASVDLFWGGGGAVYQPELI